MDFIYSWIPFKKKFRKKSNKSVQLNTETQWFLTACQLNHSLETATDDHTSLYNPPPLFSVRDFGSLFY